MVFAPRTLPPADPKARGVATFRARCCGLTFVGAAGAVDLKAHTKATKHPARGVTPKPAWITTKPARWGPPARRLPTGEALADYERAAA